MDSRQYSYEEVLKKIESARRFGNLPGVEVTKQMLAALGLKGLELPYIHVAGTNGKGSVCAFLREIFQEAGMRVGCFVSPHLVEFGERITVDGRMIAREDVARLGSRLLSLELSVTPTMFDYCTVMAALYFKEQRCDIAIIETGLGGRLDSTNALGTPEVCAITRIGYDHTAILGDSLSAIASEKAGILKPGVFAVSAEQEPEVLKVLAAHASDYYVITEEDKKRAAVYEPGLLGVHQYENAAVAEAVAERILKGTAKAVCIPAGIQKALWPGRMEILSREPFFMVDGAHNDNGVQALRRSLAALYPGERFHFVMGVMADKDYAQMVDTLAPLALDFVTVTPESERALQAKELAEYIRTRKIAARSAETVEEALAFSAKEGRTVAFGSLYFVGEIKRLLS